MPLCPMCRDRNGTSRWGGLCYECWRATERLVGRAKPPCERCGKPASVTSQGTLCTTCFNFRERQRLDKNQRERTRQEKRKRISKELVPSRLPSPSRLPAINYGIIDLYKPLFVVAWRVAQWDQASWPYESEDDRLNEANRVVWKLFQSRRRCDEFVEELTYKVAPKDRPTEGSLIVTETCLADILSQADGLSIIEAFPPVEVRKEERKEERKRKQEEAQREARRKLRFQE